MIHSNFEFEMDIFSEKENIFFSSSPNPFNWHAMCTRWSYRYCKTCAEHWTPNAEHTSSPVTNAHYTKSKNNVNIISSEISTVTLNEGNCRNVIFLYVSNYRRHCNSAWIKLSQWISRLTVFIVPIFVLIHWNWISEYKFKAHLSAWHLIIWFE